MHTQRLTRRNNILLIAVCLISHRKSNILFALKNIFLSPTTCAVTAPAEEIRLPHVPSLYYNYLDGRSNLPAEKQTFLINGQTTAYQHHPLSLRGTRTKKARPRVQLSEEHAKRLKLPTIDVNSQDLTKLVFPDGTANYVLLARRTSTCETLRALHAHVAEKGHCINSFLLRQGKKSRVKDDLGGGQYTASGYGSMGRNVSASIRPPNQPALRKSLKFADHHALAEIVGDMYTHISKCIALHCGDVYKANQKIAAINQKMAWPPVKYQHGRCCWMSSQFIIRHRHPKWLSQEWPLEKDMVAAHTDKGDLDCTMFHCYITGGGKYGKGGNVPGTDIVIFENTTGGAGYRVETCMEDTVVLVIFNSHRQLHGCIRPDVKDKNGYGQESAWSIRVIPYIPQGVYNWMLRNPSGDPFVNVP